MSRVGRGLGAVLGATRNQTSAALGWATVGQLFSSATNLALTVVAGRALGPSGLGAVGVGFSAYLVALGFQRALVNEPLVALSAPLTSRARAPATRSALTTTVLASLGATAVLLLLGIGIGGYIGHGLLLFVPWLGFALAHDLFKAVLFRDDRPAAAALSDGARFAAMVVAVVLVSSSGSDWAVVGGWGVATAGGAALAYSRIRLLPAGRRPALAWWRSEAWPLGRWLGTESLTYALGTYASTFVLAAIVGAAALGGLQAVQSVFTPLSLLAPAATLAALPPLSRDAVSAPALAKRRAALLGGGVAVVTALYMAAVIIAGSELVTAVFSSSFDRFTSLILPIGIGALVTAPGVGFVILLKAQRRGRSLLWGAGAGSLTTLAAAAAMASLYGVEGAAWGLAAGQTVRATLLTVLALRGGSVASQRQGSLVGSAGIGTPRVTGSRSKEA